ncbi:unnamed protein product [Lasius platythorax]|uniref:Uncharacterized protein n=1 Tax=Lasius platythorax TaxID=488582 RepID=A0AAV2P378_9HYME
MHSQRISLSKRTQRMLKAIRNTSATVPQLQSLTSALLLSHRLPPFPCQSRGNSSSVAAIKRILGKTRPARSNQATSKLTRAVRRAEGQQGARGGVPLMHYSFAQHPEGPLAQDWILMNLISHLLRARNALSGINESLWVSFGKALLAEREADTQRAQRSAGSMDPFTVNEVEKDNDT